jgi:G3E family GTPase
MDKKIAGLLGAVAALGTLGAAQASPTPSPSDALKANSYADLLEPIPNAAKILQALDEQAPAKSADADVKVAQYYHHHHHHHHHHAYRGLYGPRVIVVPPRRRYYHHHHHHHHHHSYYRY